MSNANQTFDPTLGLPNRVPSAKPPADQLTNVQTTPSQGVDLSGAEHLTDTEKTVIDMFTSLPQEQPAGAQLTEENMRYIIEVADRLDAATSLAFPGIFIFPILLLILIVSLKRWFWAQYVLWFSVFFIASQIRLILPQMVGYAGLAILLVYGLWSMRRIFKGKSIEKV